MYFYEVMLKAALELPATPEMIIRMRQLSFIFRKTPRPKEERSLAIEYLHRIKSSLKAGKDVFCEENATATRHASVDTSPSRCAIILEHFKFIQTHYTQWRVDAGTYQ
jgi:hypothetical protein